MEEQTIPSHGPRDRAFENKFKSRTAKLRYMLVWNKGLRFLIFPLDVLMFLGYRFYVEKINHQVLIMDRYFYDTLVDVSDGRRETRGVRLLSKLTPQPNVPVLVDISPEEAFARKGEHSVDYLSRRRISYQEFFPKNGGAVVLAGGDDLKTTRSRLEQIVLERMTA